MICPLSFSGKYGTANSCLKDSCPLYIDTTCGIRFMAEYARQNLKYNNKPTEYAHQNLNDNNTPNEFALRCQKCIDYTTCNFLGNVGEPSRCPGYHRDPPDGGCYG